MLTALTHTSRPEKSAGSRLELPLLRLWILLTHDSLSTAGTADLRDTILPFASFLMFFFFKKTKQKNPHHNDKRLENFNRFLCEPPPPKIKLKYDWFVD